MSTLHPNAPQCHHVHHNGLRCGSPALRKQNLCYYHHKAKNQRDWVRADLPALEDGNAIQHGIAQMMRLVMSGAIEYRAAQLMIDSYRLAVRNLRNLNVHPYAKDVITVDPHYDPANAGLVEEPVTYHQQEELAARGAFPADETSPKDDMKIARHEMPGMNVPNDPSPVGTAPTSLELASTTPPLAGLGKPAVLDDPHAELSDKEIDEMVMRMSGNQAYFMGEDEVPHPPAPSQVKLQDLVAELRRDLAG